MRAFALSCYSVQMSRWSLFLVALALAACGGDGDEAAPATTTTSSPPSTTAPTTSTTAEEEEVDPFTVPDDPAEITEAYVEAVINEHNRVIGDALRIQLEGGDPKEIIDRYNAIYVPEVADRRLTDLFNLDEEILSSLRRPGGNQIMRVLSIETATSACIRTVVEQDLSEVLIDPPSPTENVLILRAAVKPNELNKTRWMSEGLVTLETSEGATC